MGILVVAMLCVYAIGTLVFWRNIAFTGPRKVVFCLTILPLFFVALILDVWLVDTFAPHLLTLLADAQASDARLAQAGIHQPDTAPVVGLVISTPIALIISYCWFVLWRGRERKQAGMPVSKNAQGTASLKHRETPPSPPMPEPSPIDIARTILAIPENRSSWEDVIMLEAYSERFIWDAYGDEVERWNALAGARLQHVKREVVNGEDVFLSYKGRTLQEPLVGGREDNIIAIHTLNRLVNADSDIRYCVDSTGNSDAAFLALSPGDWRALEEEFGVQAVAYRFMPVPDDLPALQKALDSMEQVVLGRTYVNQ